jgi:hypothetical protein
MRLALIAVEIELFIDGWGWITACVVIYAVGEMKV